MKVPARDTARFCRSPDRRLRGALLHGPDEGLVAMRRRELCAALLAPEADPLRLTRIDAASVRRDPAALDAVLRARGFFGGRPVVAVEGATDALAPALEGALDGATPEDAFVVVCAGLLAGRSTLRRMFESAVDLAALQIVAEEQTKEDVEARLAELGFSAGLKPEAWARLALIATGLDRASFDRFLETLAVYALDKGKALNLKEISDLAPNGLEAEIDAFVDAVAAGQAELVGPTLRRVAATGAAPVALLIGLQRHFRHLMIAAAAGGGPDARLPVWGARRDALLAQLRRWRRDRLELAARMLYDADARVRSADRAPAMALVERCALRLAMLAER